MAECCVFKRNSTFSGNHFELARNLANGGMPRAHGIQELPELGKATSFFEIFQSYTCCIMGLLFLGYCTVDRAASISTKSLKFHRNQNALIAGVASGTCGGTVHPTDVARITTSDNTRVGSENACSIIVTEAITNFLLLDYSAVTGRRLPIQIVEKQEIQLPLCE